MNIDLSQKINTSVSQAAESKPNTLYDESDKQLLASNGIKLGLSALTASLGSIRKISPGLMVLSILSQCHRQKTRWRAIPDSAFIEKRLAHPIITIITSLSPTINKITTLAGLVGIVQNSFSKLMNYFNNPSLPREEKIKGLLIHGLNLGAEALVAKNTFSYWDMTKSLSKDTAELFKDIFGKDDTMNEFLKDLLSGRPERIMKFYEESSDLKSNKLDEHANNNKFYDFY